MYKKTSGRKHNKRFQVALPEEWEYKKAFSFPALYSHIFILCNRNVVISLTCVTCALALSFAGNAVPPDTAQLLLCHTQVPAPLFY